VLFLLFGYDFLFSLAFGGFCSFCLAGVVTFALTMRTLRHLGVGVESHALAFCKKCLKIQQKKNSFFGFLGVLYYI